MEKINIESAKYVRDLENPDLNVSIRITFDGITMSVPLSEGNRHYAEIMRQVESGELTIHDADDV